MAEGPPSLGRVGREGGKLLTDGPPLVMVDDTGVRSAYEVMVPLPTMLGRDGGWLTFLVWLWDEVGGLDSEAE